jgi:ATP phosphoribosyltransferase regulatory subunit
VLERARSVLPKNARIGAALDVLASLAAQAAEPGVRISIDLAELGGFNYESGLAFAAFTAGSPDAIARGGRYDEVGATFGRARPATDSRWTCGSSRCSYRRPRGDGPSSRPWTPIRRLRPRSRNCGRREKS